MANLKIDIRGLEVFDRLMKAARDSSLVIKQSLKKVVLWAEDDIKKQHYFGHGKITGNLQRSWYSEVPTELMGRVGTTPASMSVAGSKVFYAPYINKLYGFIPNTLARLPAIIGRIFGAAIDKLTRNVTGGG